jgi:hyaluronan synthase
LRILAAKAARRRALLGVAVILTLCAAWGLRHVATFVDRLNGEAGQFALIYTLTFSLLVWQVLLWLFDRPYRIRTSFEAAALDAGYVVVSVPVYNEDPRALAVCLHSIVNQSRRPQLVYVVNDGSSIDYRAVEKWFRGFAARHGVGVRWRYQANAGKRVAQAKCFASTPEAHVYVTVDSDTILDRRAIEQVIIPFCDRRVMSVAGVLVSANSRQNLLTRVVDLWWVVSQLTDRSAQSVLGSVMVNSGPLAAYRASMIRRHVGGYVAETFAGRPVSFSDDSMLTLYALVEGRTVQQTTAFAFMLMPERVSHHLRQYVRWMRGSTIRSIWRFRYLPLGRYAYWNHLFRWVSMALSTSVFIALFVVGPAVSRSTLSPWLLVVPILIAYIQGLRYLSFSRTDVSISSQIGTWLLTPLAAMWMLFVLRPVRWYAMATCMRTGWGTRQHGVEVELAGAAL